MKLKLLALSCCLAAAFTAQAQTAEVVQPENKTYKPTAGDITTEVSVNLEYGTFLNGGQLRVRKFTAENKALRLGTSLDYTYSKMEAEVYSSTFGISLAPGIERHFGGTNRLSPYIGVELPIGFRTSKYETDHFTVKGSTAYNSLADQANFNIGLNGLAGVDYYFAPRFYVGFEVGAGVRYNKYNDIETTFKRDFPNSSQEQEGYHSIRFYPFANGGLRVGFVF
ncbi:opacity family porin [Pontibacter ramchanderi]|uniref:Outer membrane protein with beta-barrel domain n=1 Tax=Pontibacter ramchanderi TaxID=1179743 RepID=A0A2N3UC85_9BACT|nr:opacity family porin [Pontibacter ramchanderi]PKV66984.1 outer membrane protein with beta-barrel domain [Pontibacter ramchanderi]